jgi:hypothetical protein
MDPSNIGSFVIWVGPRRTQASTSHRQYKIHTVIHSSVICHTTGPQPLPKRFLHLMRSTASSFKWEYPLLSPRSSSNCLRLLPRLLVTSFRPCIFPSITSFRRQFLRKIRPIQLAFRFLISCRIFLCSLTLSNKFLVWWWIINSRNHLPTKDDVIIYDCMYYFDL